QFQQLPLGDALGVVDGLPPRRVGDRAVGGGDPVAARLGHVVGDQVVLDADVEDRSAGVALASGAAAQLVVQAAAGVAAVADDVEAAGLHHPVPVAHVAAAQADVGAASGHLGGHGDPAVGAGLGDDRGLVGVVLGVEDDALQPGPLQALGEPFGLGDVLGADEDGTARGVHLRHLLDDGVLLLLGRGVEAVLLVDADVGLVGRDDRDFQLVELAQLLGDGHRGAGHAAA